jgi:thioredoxin 1
MNIKIVVSVLAMFAVLGVIMLSGNKSESNKEASSSQNRMERIVPKSESSQNQTSENSTARYTEYSKTLLDQSADKRRVLYFYASWCPTCRVADPDLSANADKFPEDVVVLRVNYNDPDTDQEEKDLAKKYAITYQHTFVQIDREGKEVTKWNGGKTEELLANLE